MDSKNERSIQKLFLNILAQLLDIFRIVDFHLSDVMFSCFFQYFVFDFHMAPAILFDRIITITVSNLTANLLVTDINQCIKSTNY